VKSSHIRRTIILLFPILASHLGAQPSDLRLEHISLAQGLSQSTINAITQDSRGFIWFGTQDGLNRYDGYSITVFKHNSTDSNSLADNSIWGLLSDSRGDVWVGTMRGGVDRYVVSQNRFVHYAHRVNDSSTISENNIISLFEDSEKSIWLGTLNNGLNRFEQGTGKFTRFLFEGKKPHSLSNNTVWSICEDRRKNLWVATWRGLCRLSLDSSTAGNSRFSDYHHSPSDPTSLSGENIRTLYVDRQGVLWVGTWGAGLNRYDHKTNSFKRYRHNPKDERTISSDLILSLCEDVKGNLWIGTNDAGLNVYDRNNDAFVRYRSAPQNPSSLNNDQVSALFEDNAGILWIGTGAGGVNVYDWRKNRFAHYRDDLNRPDDMSGSDVWAILEDSRRELWVGTYGNGLNRFDRTRKRVKTYLFNPKVRHSLSSNNVLSLCETSDGDIWVGTEGGGLNRFIKTKETFTRYRHNPADRNSISFDEVTALCEDRNGDLWIGTNGGSVDRLHRKTNTFTHYVADEKNPRALAGTTVMVIYEDTRGSMWIGTLGGGVHRFIPESNSFRRYQPNAEAASGVNNNTVLSMYEDSAGILWMGTYGGGLNRFDPADESFTHFTELNGLPNDVVYGILPDRRGNLWLSTNKGISRFDPKTAAFRNYDLRDGLQGNEYNQGSHFASASGELLFGGINGVNAFFPDSIRENEYIPPVYLTNFKVFDTSVPLSTVLTTSNEIELSYAENFFSFEFVALNFTSPEKNRYQYKLEGLDKDWIATTASRRYASYTNLDPGDYVLRVKGSNNDGVWNERGIAVGITITPPYWKTWWFRTLAAFAGAALLFFMYRYRVNKLLEIERIRSSIAVDLHDDIGSTLTEIALYSDVGLREVRAKAHEAHMDGKLNKVESLLEDIGTTSRGLIDAMNDIVWAVDPKNDSFEFLLLRMKTHAARMFDAKGINYEIDIPEELSHLHLPLGFRRRFYLIFKEAVNNIMRHAHPTKVLLKIRKEGRSPAFGEASLVMTIVDDGKGFDVARANEGNGMNNMKKRAESLNGNLTIESAPDKGTTVRLRAGIP
jgi:ligand-binding sensor domain-containing protein/signal transduction histidine kinase